MEDITHYACMACKGTAPDAGVCETDGCAMKGVPLQPCGCVDGMHQRSM